jgi:energy-coupling factor transport system permease protein
LSERRHLHPAAWWCWALGLAVAASRTTNPLLLLSIVAVCGFVVAARRSIAPWSRSYAAFVRIGVFIVVLRLILQTLFGIRLPGHVLFSIPRAHLPSWAAGVSVGGPVTLESLLGAAYDALRLVALLAASGAANSLASPYRLLRCLPRALYEAGVAVTIALAFAPQAITSIGQVRAARRLRGRPTRGLAGVRGLAVPVLEGALERSIALAASMDARGYGRRGERDRRAVRVGAAVTLLGLVAVAIGVYALLDVGAPAAIRLPALGVGGALLATGLLAGGRRNERTRYRPDRWRAPELAVAGSGIAAAVALVTAGLLHVGGLHPGTNPVEPPYLPALPTFGILLGLLPAVLAPRPPVAVRAARHPAALSRTTPPGVAA